MAASDGPVLIAYDGSPPARQAVADAARLLGGHRALVVTVWEEGLAFMGASMQPQGVMSPEMIDPQAALALDREVRSHAEIVAQDGAELARSLGLDAEPLAVAAGDVAHSLLSVADERGASAIVVGSRGLTGLRSRLEGSTSKAVLKRASCPVLVVHEPGDGESAARGHE